MKQWAAILLLVALNLLLWSVPTPSGLSVTFFDVGQGDSILIEGPRGAQVLIDGGPDAGVLRELASRMPFWDRTLDAVIATHPDADHIGGLPSVLERYGVAHILEPGVPNDTKMWASFVGAVNAEIKGSKASHFVARRGMRLALGGSAYADILYPDRDVAGVRDTNAGSVVVRVVYGATSFLLTGDAPTKVEYELMNYSSQTNIKSTVLKAGHHGSKTSSSEEWVSVVAPEYVVFSRGCDNRYGHPAEEVVNRFMKFKIPTLDTCEEGTITFKSEGTTLRPPSLR